MNSLLRKSLANLDLLNMIIGIDGKENLKKVPSFCGELMREVEKMYGFHHKDEYDWGVKSEVIEIAGGKYARSSLIEKSLERPCKNQIALETADLSAAVFHQKYFKTQKPCVVRKIRQRTKVKTSRFM